MILNVLPIIPQLGKKMRASPSKVIIKDPFAFALSLGHMAQNSNFASVHANSITNKENKARNPTFEDVALHGSLEYL